MEFVEAESNLNDIISEYDMINGWTWDYEGEGEDGEYEETEDGFFNS